MKRINPLLFLPGTICWGLIGVGFAKDDMFFVGTGFGVAGVTLIMGVVAAARGSSAKKAEASRIWAGGTPGKAKVVDISTKGGGMNDNPLIDFELDVCLDGQPPYRAEVSVIVSMLAIPRVQPGCEIEVRVDPQDRSKVVIDEKLTYLRYS